MATRVIDDSKLQDIAVAIQGKDGGGQMTVDQMPARIAEIPTQDNTLLYSLINRSITSIENSEVTSIGACAFQRCTNLTSVSLPNVTSITGDYAFQNCTNLTSVSLPNVTSIGGYTFQNCTNLTSVSLPNVTSIGTSPFQNCTNLMSVSLPNVTSIGSSPFRECTNLTSVSLPNVTSISEYAFYRSGLRNLYAPSTITLVLNSFFQAFYVTRLFFPNVETIGRASFQYCSRLSTIVLHKHADLQDSNVFNNGCPAIIYVKPGDLEWYSTATNWSTLYAQNRIKSIEDLTGDDLAWYQEQLARYQAQTA